MNDREEKAALIARLMCNIENFGYCNRSPRRKKGDAALHKLQGLPYTKLTELLFFSIYPTEALSSRTKYTSGSMLPFLTRKATESSRELSTSPTFSAASIAISN